MKIWIKKATDLWSKGKVKEYDNLQYCIDDLFATEDFGKFKPGVIVEKADDMTKKKSGEECDYEVIIYDTWIE